MYTVDTRLSSSIVLLRQHMRGRQRGIKGRSHLIPAPKGCIRFALLPLALAGAASISISSLPEFFLPLVAAALECLAV